MDNSFNKLFTHIYPRYSVDYKLKDIYKSIFYYYSNKYKYISYHDLFDGDNLFCLNDARTGIFLVLNMLPPGEVILPAYICQVVAKAVVLSGHQPVFIDIDYDNQLSMPLKKVKEKISPKTRAIIAAHLLGIPCNIIELLELSKNSNIVLLEDAAAALGGYIQKKPLGSFGDASVISFGKGKSLWINKGGLLLLNNNNIKNNLINSLDQLKKSSSFLSLLIALVNKILYHPQLYRWAYKIQRDRKGGDFWEDGVSDKSRITSKLMDSFTRNLIFTQYDSWENKILRRRQIAKAYRENICNAQLKHLEVSNGMQPSWPYYPLLVNRRKSFFYYMHNRGIDLNWSWNYSAAEIFGQTDCPNASDMAKKILSLPTHSDLREQDVDYIIKIANEFS